jgi:hypothetical protein
LEFSTFDNNLLSDDGEDQDGWYGVEATTDNNEFDAFPQFSPHRNRGYTVDVNSETAVPYNSEKEEEKKLALIELNKPLYKGTNVAYYSNVHSDAPLTKHQHLLILLQLQKSHSLTQVSEYFSFFIL